MLEPDANRLLKIMGREDQAKGIFLGDQLAQAMSLLERAIDEQDALFAPDPK